jgi:hypothetical protein
MALSVSGPVWGGTLDGSFTGMAATLSAATLAPGATSTVSTGIQWTALDNADLGASGSATWTVNCGEAAPVIFDNTPAVVPANLQSIGPEAYSYNEFGAQVQFAGTARKLSAATVTMSDWACQSGGWNTNDCLTTPGATFTVPITFNVYNVGAGNAVGSLVATKTQPFTIPYRPSADAVYCLAVGTDSNGGNDLGKWYNLADNTCYNGLATNIVFTFAGETLPNTAIFGITFNTDNHGYSPLGGSGSPTDALNIGLNTAALPSIGSFLPDAQSAYAYFTYAPFYLDGGAGGASFRLDTGPTTASSVGAWGSQEASVQITANN